MKTVKFFMSMLIMLAFFSMNETYGQWLYNGTHIYNNNTGYVGIGNNSPSKLLYVGKNMTEPTITVRNFGGGGGATFQMLDDASGADWKFKATSTGGFKIRDNSFGLDVMTFEANSDANVLYVDASGQVGIGRTTPSRKLDVNGKVNFSWDADYTFMYLNLNNAFPSGNTGIIYQYDGSYKYWMFWRNLENIVRFTTDPSGSRNDMVLTQDGNVGMGTDIPAGKLEIHPSDNYYTQLARSNVRRNYFYHRELPADGDGQAAIYAYRSRDAQNDGTGYELYGTNNAISGFALWGDVYTFTVAGYNWMDHIRSGGVIGARDDAAVWGVLGYTHSGGGQYGGYFSSYTSGAGKASQQAMTGIGMGAWGDLFGADIHGKVYGLYAEGENYAMFSHGATYKDNLDVHLQESANGTNTVLYTYVSTDVCVQTSGVATLSSGKSTIAFDPAFTSIVSASEPVVVTVTPVGESNGVHLSDVTSAGFTIVENNAGRSNVTVNYIAIGKRAGYENPSLAPEVIEAGYTTKLANGLHADADKETDGQGLYYENGQLVVGKHPSTFRDASNKKEEIANPVTTVSHSDGANDSVKGTMDTK